MSKRAGRLEKKREGSDCTDTVREKLQSDVNRYCKDERKKCYIEDSCADLEAKMAIVNACIQARVAINTKCFRGGDAGHNEAINQAVNGLIRCQGIYFPKCMTPPEPIPVPEPDPSFMKKMEEITGLAGAALIIYLIISEGSRLFPPRNLVPIP